VIDKNGINTRLFRKPGADKVRRVISKLVKEIVVLNPENKTEIIAISCAPKPVYRNLEENGVIKVHPAIVKIELEHLDKNFFFLCIAVTFEEIFHKESEILLNVEIKNNFNGINSNNNPSEFFF
jgi:hypothetical protein